MPGGVVAGGCHIFHTRASGGGGGVDLIRFWLGTCHPISGISKSIPVPYTNLVKKLSIYLFFVQKFTKIDTFLYTKMVRIDTVPYTKIVKTIPLPDGTSPVSTQNIHCAGFILNPLFVL